MCTHLRAFLVAQDPNTLASERSLDALINMLISHIAQGSAIARTLELVVHSDLAVMTA